MQHRHHIPPPILSLAWRRLFVVLLSVTSGALLAARSLDGGAPQLRHIVTAVCLILATASMWFLADAIRPWLAPPDNAVAQRVRAHAGSRAHAGLLWMTAGAWLYLWAATAHPGVLPAVRVAIADLLVTVFLVGLLLPVAIVAWREPDADHAMGPSALLRSRFSGPDAGGHKIVAGLMLLTGILLGLAGDTERRESPLGRAVLIAALVFIIAASVAISWQLLLHDRRGGEDVDH